MLIYDILPGFSHVVALRSQPLGQTRNFRRFDLYIYIIIFITNAYPVATSVQQSVHIATKLACIAIVDLRASSVSHCPFILTEKNRVPTFCCKQKKKVSGYDE